MEEIRIVCLLKHEIFVTVLTKKKRIISQLDYRIIACIKHNFIPLFYFI